ncbi:MAG: hypothetical protein ACYCWN_12010 [Ferrimicrobium sp.]
MTGEVNHYLADPIFDDSVEGWAGRNYAMTRLGRRQYDDAASGSRVHARPQRYQLHLLIPSRSLGYPEAGPTINGTGSAFISHSLVAG